MLKWVTDYITYVEEHPRNFNRDVKNNIRQIKELISRDDIFYKDADPKCFVEFCENCFKHREGVMAGKPLLLNMEQKYIVACILGIKTYDAKKKKYIRYFNEMDLFVARKWGKDHLIAPLVCYFIGLDREPKAWGQIVAENAKQSYRTFEIIENEIKNEPLSQIFFKSGSKEKRTIRCKINGGKLEYLSGRIKGKDGDNCSVGVVNECHEVTNFNQYNAIKTSMGAREQPMMLVISSAGVTPESLYESLLDRNRAFLEKKKLGKDDRIFALMYGIDDDDDIEDTSCWIKANPAMYENRPTLDFLKKQWASMKSDPVQRSTFISKHLNRQIGAVSAFYNISEIRQRCMQEPITKEMIYDTYATGGVDLASTTDLCNATAKVLLADGRSVILQAYFIASEWLDRNSKKDKQDYQSFTAMNTKDPVTSRLVIVTQGATVDYHAVTQWFVMLRDEYQINFLKIGYDKAMSNYWVADMVENGFNCEHVEFDKFNRVENRDGGILTPCYQGIGLDPAIRLSKPMLETGKYIVDKNNALFLYCFYNVKVTSNNDNKLSVSKAKSNGHIDGCIGVYNSEIAYTRAKEFAQKSGYWESVGKYFAV